MKKFVPYNLILLGMVVLTFGCRSSNIKGGRENFDVFYEKFLTDSSFQIQRIQFPLPGIKAGEESEEEDSTYYWTKEEWIMLKKPELEGTEFKRNLQVSDTLATDEIFTENAGFYFKTVYEPIKKKWYLVYMVDSGL